MRSARSSRGRRGLLEQDRDVARSGRHLLVPRGRRRARPRHVDRSHSRTGPVAVEADEDVATPLAQPARHAEPSALVDLGDPAVIGWVGGDDEQRGGASAAATAGSQRGDAGGRDRGGRRRRAGQRTSSSAVMVGRRSGRRGCGGRCEVLGSCIDPSSTSNSLLCGLQPNEWWARGDLNSCAAGGVGCRPVVFSRPEQGECSAVGQGCPVLYRLVLSRS